jgi:Holliday junction resolvase YEN1
VSLKKTEWDAKNPNQTTKKPSKETTSNKQDHKTVGHLEGITIHNGFWSIDSSPGDSADPDGVESKARGGKKKRIPRVSILDLI